MSIHCLFDWGQDIQFWPFRYHTVCQSLSIEVRTRYPVLTPFLNLSSVHCFSSTDNITFSTPLLHFTSIHCLSTLRQSTASQVRTRYLYLVLPLHSLMSINCHLVWGQDNQFSPFLHHTCSMSIHYIYIQFCPPSTALCQSLPIPARTRYPIQFCPPSTALCQSLPIPARTRNPFMSPLFYFMSILCLMKWGQDI